MNYWLDKRKQEEKISENTDNKYSIIKTGFKKWRVYKNYINHHKPIKRK